MTTGGAPEDGVSVHELLSRMRAGDPEAARLFCVRMEPFLRRVSRRWLTSAVRRQVDSMDITQSVLRRVVGGAAPSDLGSEARVLAWAATVVRNRIRTLARHRRDLGGQAVDAALEAGDLPAAPSSPDERVAQAEEVHGFHEALATLPGDEQQVVMLRDFDGLEFDVVAQVLGRPSADAARKLHDRAIARLRDILTRAGRPKER